MSASCQELVEESRGDVMARQIDGRIEIPPMTPEKQQQMLAALERARRLREELLTARGGKLFPSAGADLDELREERESELP